MFVSIVRFFNLVVLTVSFLLSVAHAADNKQAYYRSFWSPTYHGKLLDYCLPDKKQCGTKVADQYCQMMGYDKSSKSTIAYNVGVTQYLGACTGCKSWMCNGFQRISCVAKTLHKPTKDYYFRSKKYVVPRFNHYRVDWCYKDGKGCGKQAAFSFCRRMGYMHEQGYTIEAHVAATRALGNQRLCFGDDCNAFKSITCYR